MRYLWMGLYCWTLVSSCWAAGAQDLRQLEKLAEGFLKRELSLRPATWTLGQLDRKLVVPACSQPKADWANSNVTTGSTFIVLSCPDLGWSLRLAVRISEKKMGVVLNRAMTVGEILTEADVRLVDITNPALAQNVLSDPALLIGQSMRTGAPAGAWVRSFMVRPPYLVKSNQRVKVIAQGEGFTAVADGMAIANASLGEQVSVRLGSGRVIRGQVQADGSVAVIY
ncbi:flagellar basal body P-ring formation chaperone FlgA [Neisseriaceae bacterium TC5R-5]|nr:flagellar basal body P-ring formation chaperone FlgA [Neisseriaceae bacterium TC5R-5]